MAGDSLLVVGVVLVLSYSPLQTAAQNVTITGAHAVAGVGHDLICNYSAPDPIPSLEYRWCARDICRPISTNNLYDLVLVELSDAHDSYMCEVSQLGTDTVLGSTTGSLSVKIPDFLMSFNRASGGGRTNYVGLNVSIACQTRFLHNLVDITTDITISHSNGTEVAASERFIITNTAGEDFERTLTFTPISEGDAGVYLCTGTARSATSNSLVTSGTGRQNLTIATVHVPSIEVGVSPTAGRYIDIPPYNSLTLTCSATITVRGVATPLHMVFQWRQDRNGSEESPISPEQVSHSDLFGAQGNSVLSLTLTQPGFYSYTCVSSLDVTPACDVITGTRTVNITIAGPSGPTPPVDLTTPPSTLFHDRVTVHFHVPSLTYDPEVYWVRYGTSSSNLTEESTHPVSSGSSIVAVDISLSVMLEGLITNTTYYYLVVANNSVGMAESTISTFKTGLDECNNCDANAECTNTPGSSTCTCNQGYNGDGVNCTGSNSSSLFQLRLTGLRDCASWKADALSSKDQDIIQAIVDNVAFRCGCGFTNNHITNREFKCFPSSPRAVTYRAMLHGTLHVPSPELLQYIEDWLSSTSPLTVQLQLLSVDSSCSVVIDSSAEGECNAGGSEKSSSAVTGIVAGIVIAVVVLLILVALIVIAAQVYRHRYSTINIKETEHRSGDIQLNGDLMSTQIEEDNNEDDMITPSHTLPSLRLSTSRSSSLPAGTRDDTIDSNPAYDMITQGQSIGDEDPEAHYSVVDMQ